MKPSNSWWSLAEHPCRDRPPHVVFFVALPLQLDSDLRNEQAMAKATCDFEPIQLACLAIEKYITPWDVHWLVAASCGPEFTSTLNLERKYMKVSTKLSRFHAVSWSRLTRALFIYERYLNEREAIDASKMPKMWLCDANCDMNAGCARAAWYGTQSGLVFLRRERPLVRLKTCHEVVYIATALRARDTMVVNQRPKTRSHVLTFWIETGLPDPAATVCQPEIPHPEIVSSSATIHNKAQRFEIRC